MRTAVPVLVLLALASRLPAQGTTPPPPPKPDPAALDRHLKAWEAKMRGVTTLSTLITRVDTDKVMKSTTEYTGYGLYKRAGSPGSVPLNLAKLELTVKGKKDIAEKIVSTGTYLYQYVPTRKEIHQHEIPKPKVGAPADDTFLGLVFGMKADDAKKRYGLSLFKEDADWVYVDITPKHPADKAEFQRARLVLSKATYLPRQLWFEGNNKNEVLWDLPRSAAGVEIDRRHFDAPRAEAGWKIVPVTKSAPGVTPPPKVIRNSKEK